MTAPRTLPFPDHRGTSLARLGGLDVRLAATDCERQAAFDLRYRVFCEELGATLPGANARKRIETDAFDPCCDHIIVCDTTLSAADGRYPVVGTCRALRPEAVSAGFYSQTEFDVLPMLARHPGQRFCEVGRSCVAATHRSRRSVEALWCGLWAYAARYGIDAYFGTASFPGTDPNAHDEALAYLYHHARAPDDWQVSAHPDRSVAMDARPPQQINPRRALRAMPPLVRAYLRINSQVGQTGYIDDQFGTIDVMIITRLAIAPTPYRERFSRASVSEAQLGVL